MNTGTRRERSPLPAVKNDRAGKTIAIELTDDDREEALEFLSLRPFHTVILAGWIHDHGIVSPLHRGKFYGTRDASGRFDGVAMIGRNLLFEARSDDAVIAFGERARECSDINMVFASEKQLATFWSHFRATSPIPAMSRHRLIMSDGNVPENVGSLPELRVATRDDLDHVVKAHAQIVIDETGVDPLETEPDGFRSRCAIRVDQGRVWVWIKDDRLLFKTDVVSVTPRAIYGEGLWVDPQTRGQGIGTRCLVTFCRQLSLGNTLFCGFLDMQYPFDRSLYAKAGFNAGDEYVRVYL